MGHSTNRSHTDVFGQEFISCKVGKDFSEFETLLVSFFITSGLDSSQLTGDCAFHGTEDSNNI